MALDFFAGCAGGAAGVIVGHPLDTVKVRLQTQDPSNLKYRGTFHCLSTIIKQESVSGLYKGISSPLFGVAGVNAIIFGVYGALRPYVSSSPGNDALWAHFAAGSISGAVQSVVASPMELVKTRMQINEDNAKSRKVGPVEVLRGIYRNEGGLFRGVFKGWGITLGREIPGFGFYFASYEALTRFGNGEVGTLGMMLAGGMAGVISWIVTFPIDVVKTRLQCDDSGKYTGIIDCIRKTYSSEGHRAFTRGLVSTVIRAFPTNAATFTVVTWIMRFAGETQEDDVKSSRQYLDELLNETTKLQERFEDTLRLKVPWYSLNSNSLTSCSLASQCAASAQRYADKTQVYFNFYQSLQQQAEEDATSETKVTDSEEEEEEEEDVGIERKHQVPILLHEKLAMHMHEDSKICISGSRENSGNDTQELLPKQQTEQSRVSDVACISSSNRSQIDASVDDNEHHNRHGDNAVRHNNHILFTSKSSSSAITTEALVERETDAKPVNTVVSCYGKTQMVNNNGNTKLNDDHYRSGHNSSISTSRSLIHGNRTLSHEASSFPAERVIVAADTATKYLDNDLEKRIAGASEIHRNASEFLNSYEDDHNEGEDTTGQTLSSRELAYLSKSLDIPTHILQAASLKQKYRDSDPTTKEKLPSPVSKIETKVINASNTHATTLTHQAASTNSKRTQTWKKYCKTPAFNICKCFEDHCVCYF